MFDRIALARATVLRPEMAVRTPAAVETAWSRLKEARGQPITIDRMARLEPRHLADARPTSTVADIDAIRQRVAAQVRAMRGIPTGGDAA